MPTSTVVLSSRSSAVALLAWEDEASGVEEAGRTHAGSPRAAADAGGRNPAQHLSAAGPSGPIFRGMVKRSEKTRYMRQHHQQRTAHVEVRHKGADHGPRVPATARTLIRELLGCDREATERHLAHGSDEELGSAYDRATFLNQRRKMIQLWVDLLDDLASHKALEMPACTEFTTARAV